MNNIPPIFNRYMQDVMSCELVANFICILIYTHRIIKKKENYRFSFNYSQISKTFVYCFNLFLADTWFLLNFFKQWL